MPASRLDGWYGPPRDFNYMSEVQPVFTRHCLACHDYGKSGAAKLSSPDREPCFNVAYRQLWTRGYITVPGAGARTDDAGVLLGAAASKVIQTLDRGHHGVKLDKESRDRLVTWLDINAPYYPTYATNFPDNFTGRSPLNDPQTARLKAIFGDRLNEVSFDRPELSPALAMLPGPTDPKYREVISILQAGKAVLQKNPGATGRALSPANSISGASRSIRRDTPRNCCGERRFWRGERCTTKNDQ